MSRDSSSFGAQIVTVPSLDVPSSSLARRGRRTGRSPGRGTRNFLELWTCKSGNNPTNYCDPAYDRLIEQARSTPDDDARFAIYEQAEAMLTGPEGAFPIIPINWGTSPIIRRESVKGLELNLLGQFDWTKLTIGGGA